MTKLDQLAKDYKEINATRLEVLTEIEKKKQISERLWNVLHDINEEYVAEQARQTNIESILKLCLTGE